MKSFLPLLLCALAAISCQKGRKSIPTESKFETPAYDHRAEMRLMYVFMQADATILNDCAAKTYDHLGSDTTIDALYDKCVASHQRQIARLKEMPAEPPDLADCRNYLVEMNLAFGTMLESFTENRFGHYSITKEDYAIYIASYTDFQSNKKRLDLKIP